jgi:hypothetical protein
MSASIVMPSWRQVAVAENLVLGQRALVAGVLVDDLGLDQPGDEVVARIASVLGDEVAQGLVDPGARGCRFLARQAGGAECGPVELIAEFYHVLAFQAHRPSDRRHRQAGAELGVEVDGVLIEQPVEQDVHRFLNPALVPPVEHLGPLEQGLGGRAQALVLLADHRQDGLADGAHAGALVVAFRREDQVLAEADLAGAVREEGVGVALDIAHLDFRHAEQGAQAAGLDGCGVAQAVHVVGIVALEIDAGIGDLGLHVEHFAVARIVRHDRGQGVGGHGLSLSGCGGLLKRRLRADPIA